MRSVLLLAINSYISTMPTLSTILRFSDLVPRHLQNPPQPKIWDGISAKEPPQLCADLQGM